MEFGVGADGWLDDQVADARNALWPLDFQFDTTADGRTLTLLNVIDEYTRE